MRKRRAALLGVSCVAACVIMCSRDNIREFILEFKNRDIIQGVIVHVLPRLYTISGEELIPADGMGKQNSDDRSSFVYIRYMKDGKPCLAKADHKYDVSFLHPGVRVLVRPDRKNAASVHIT